MRKILNLIYISILLLSFSAVPSYANVIDNDSIMKVVLVEGNDATEVVKVYKGELVLAVPQVDSLELKYIQKVGIYKGELVMAVPQTKESFNLYTNNKERRLTSENSEVATKYRVRWVTMNDIGFKDIPMIIPLMELIS